MQSEARDKSVSMTKGVAIILMVLAHTGFSRLGDSYINMFHMPLFFFFSGYCFKNVYLNDFRGYFIKRMKGAYWPFVKWGIIFLLLHNVFFALNIYNGEYGFNGKVSQVYTITDFLKNGAFIIGSMSHAERLLGGYWFLHTYFFAAFFTFFTIWLFKKIKVPTITGGGVFYCWQVR